jgi:ABC-type phosphate transport system substrate-binding protein
MRLATTLFLLLLSLPAQAQVSVITHKSVPVTSLDKEDLLEVFTGEIQFWDNKVPIVLVDMKPNNETKEIFYTFLGKSPSRMKAIWLKRMLSGEGDPPIATESEEEMISRVSSTPGAIGFVSRSLVNDSVKVVAVIHKRTS